MLAANIWHWWIGVVMLAAGIGVSISLIVGYLRNVTATRYPGGRRERELDL